MRQKKETKALQRALEWLAGKKSQSIEKPKSRRRTVKEQIESFPRIADLEAHWFKDALRDLQPAMLKRETATVQPDYSKKGKFGIHSHPKYHKPSMPSVQDLLYFNELSSKAMVISAMNPLGKVAGYTFVKKPRKPEKAIIDLSAESRLYNLKKERIDAIRSQIAQLNRLQQSAERNKKIFDLFAEWRCIGVEITDLIKGAVKKAGWKMRFVPMPGYYFSHGYYLSTPSSPSPAENRVKIQPTIPSKPRTVTDAERRRRMRLLHQQQKKRIRIR